VSRYDDVQRASGDRDTFLSGHGGVLEMINDKVPIPSGLFIYQDRPHHTMFRSLFTKAFTPKSVAELEPKMRAFCKSALDPLVEGGEFNFIDDLGLELPLRVIGMLLGIPEQDLKPMQKRMSERSHIEPGKPKANNDLSPDDAFGEYIDWRVTHPSDDLMTELLNTEILDDRGEKRKLHRDEIMTMVGMLAAAGNETTNRLIGWTGKLLADYPDQRRQVYENRALIPQAIEEVLRFEPPGLYVGRVAAKDAAFHGRTIPKGSTLLCLLPAANRDESKFQNGDVFDVQRGRTPHFTFGYGFHNCIGNVLARIEGRIALDEILNRFPEWEVDLDHAKFSSTSTVRGWDTLPAYTPRSKRGH
jgi:cytochrome P450